jgi:two-component system sensor histidine kinase YesM
LTQKSIEIAEMTESLATLFRNNVSSTDSMATFAAELDNVENYLIIQRYRFPEKFTFIKKIEDDDIYDYKMPVLTMQPLVENAIHHGLELKSGHGTVTIRAFFTQDTLTIYVIDDGIGMDSDRFKALEIALAENKTPQIQNIRKNSGIAMINVNQRIKFFYGSNYGLRVYSTHCVGTTIEIRLPKANA